MNRFRAALALTLLFVLSAKCGSANRRIRATAKVFRQKPLAEVVRLEIGGFDRTEEFRELDQLGAFQIGMTVAQIEQLLGLPDSVWNDVPEVHMFDL